MKIFVTGGTGGIGILLLPKLVLQGHEVLFLTRGDSLPSQHPTAQAITGDLLQPDSYQAELQGVDVVIHMAGITHTNNHKLYHDTNVHGTEVLIEAAMRSGVNRFIYMSTRAVSEDGGAYSKSKSRAEALVRDSGLDWTIIRPAAVYGASQT